MGQYSRSIKTRPQYLHGKEKQMTSSLSAELRLYWSSCSVLAEFVAHMIRTVFAK